MSGGALRTSEPSEPHLAGTAGTRAVATPTPDTLTAEKFGRAVVWRGGVMSRASDREAEAVTEVSLCCSF